jgi:RNA polymerase sigma-70 factor, ECF subfamily
MPSNIKQIQFDRQLDLMQIREFRRSGNIEVLSGLYTKYIHLIYGLCLLHLGDRAQARTAVKEIFEKVTVEAIKHEVTHFKPWLYQISKKYCLKKKGTPVDKLSVKVAIEKEHPIDNDIQITDSLSECIKTLDKQSQQCIDQFYRKNKCYREIAKKLNISEIEVKELIMEAKQKILVCLENKVQKAQASRLD